MKTPNALGGTDTEYELDPSTLSRTGLSRRRQFYNDPTVPQPDRRIPSERAPCEFRLPR